MSFEQVHVIGEQRAAANRERILFEQDEVEVEFRRNAEANRRLPLKLAVFIACLRMRCDNANFSAKVGFECPRALRLGLPQALPRERLV